MMKNLFLTVACVTAPLSVMGGGGSAPKGGGSTGGKGGTSFDTYVPPRLERTKPAKGEEYLTDLLIWFNNNEGRLNRKVDLRRTDLSDPNSPFGLFAMDDIYGKELIMSVPRKKLFTVEGVDKDTQFIESALPCETAFRLIEEMERGSSSEFAGYINFLKNQKSSLPSTWSQSGKDFLHDVIEELPPDDATTWIEHEWYTECQGADEPWKEEAAMMLISRGWDYVMIPMYDVMNHRNGNYFNTFSDSIGDASKDVIQVRASRRIAKGEQIFTSYNMCDDCDARKENYGTPEILRDYGFVEEYPQRWIFDDVLKFEIHDSSSVWEEEETNIFRLEAPKDDSLEIKWLGDAERGEEDREFLVWELERLDQLKTKFDYEKMFVPKEEYDVIVQYHAALSKALSLAIESIPVDLSAHEMYDEL